MLILCVGPDSFRALQKAQELEKAFIEKYDPRGLSVEQLEEGAGSIDAVIERVNTVSLFSPRRYIRVSGLIHSCPKTKQQALIHALGKDPERVIVVSVEREMPSATLASIFSVVPKFLRYDFPVLSGPEFQKWVHLMALRLGIDHPQLVARLSQEADGDCWLVTNELIKISVGGERERIETVDSRGIFQHTEEYLTDSPFGRRLLLDEDALSQVLATMHTQTRAALRVRDGSTTGLHPYTVKKMQHHYSGLEEKHAHALIALFMQRAGYGVDTETVCLL